MVSLHNTTRFKNWILPALLIFALSFEVFASARSTYDVYLLAREPEIGGAVDSASAWVSVPSAGEFTRVSSDADAAKQTFFGVGYTIESLWIGVKCVEPDMEKIKAAEPDGGSLWNDDSVEIFISVEGQDTYYQFIVSAIGSKWSGLWKYYDDGRTEKKEDIPVGSWDAGLSRGEECWCVEIKIPFEMLGNLPERNETWKFNVSRNIHSLPARQLTSWSPLLEQGNHEPANFGEIAFKESIAAPELADAIREMDTETDTKEAVFFFSRPFSGMFYKDFVVTGRSRRIRGERRIVYSQGSYVSPRISPCGNEILYTSLLGGDMGIWSAGLDGKDARRLCDGAHAEWSSSGEKIVFHRNGKIIEREVDTGKERAVIPAGWGFAKFPVYVTDEDIVFVGENAGGHGVYLAGLDSGGPPRLLLEARSEITSGPAISPDGKMIAYQDGAHIHAFCLDSGESRRITTAGGVQSWPAWSSDGLGICYLQSPESLSERHDIYYTSLGEPYRTGRVMRDVHPSFDWKGISPVISWEELKNKGDWDVLQPGGKTVVAANGWFEFVVSAGGNEIFLRPKETGERVEFLFLDGDGEKASAIKDVVASEGKDDGEAVHVEVLLASGRGKPLKAVIKVPRHSPFVEVKPLENVSAVFVKKNLEKIILPDRFASDMVFCPFGFSDDDIVLPHAPFITGLFGIQKKGMLLVLTPSAGQKASLSKQGDRGFFEAIGAELSGESVFISLLHGDELWFHKPVKTDGENAGVIAWEQPFHACWRIAAEGEKRYSRMLYGEKLAGMDKLRLAFEKNAAETPRSVLIYLYGRDVHTPLTVKTPVDVLYDALGTKQTRDLLDIQGLRGYRVAEEWVPWGFYREYFEGKIDDITGRDASVFGGIRVSTEGSYKLVQYLQDDIISILRELDNRLGEYQDFISSLNGEAVIPGDSVEELNRALVFSPAACLEEIALSKGDIREMRGWLRANRKFTEFLEAAGSAAEERINLLGQCRRSVTELRERAVAQFSREPDRAVFYGPLIKQTEDILRNRHYLEGGWKGEKPMEGLLK